MESAQHRYAAFHRVAKNWKAGVMVLKSCEGFTIPHPKKVDLVLFRGEKTTVFRPPPAL